MCSDAYQVVYNGKSIATSSFDKMSSTPFVGLSTTEEGDTYVLIRQSAGDGQYTVDICLSMEQFSNIMAVLRGLEMYLMDMELKKSDFLLPTPLVDVETSSGDASVDTGTQQSTKNSRKRKREQIKPEDNNTEKL